MKLIVLGAAAGGGFPQWNSNAPACNRARAGDPAVRPRTQASLAASADGKRWIIVNASPDIGQQIAQTPDLHPNTGLRSSPISAVVLTGGDVDCIAGLLSLRERQEFALYAPPQVLTILQANRIFEVLNKDYVQRRAMETDSAQEILDAKGLALGISVEAFTVPGKIPLYLETGEADPATIAEDKGTIGLCISQTGSSMGCYYIPGCAQMHESLAARLQNQNVVFFDGTLWSDNEMIARDLGAKTGKRMGHMSVGDADGSITAFADLRVKRKIFVHINNSNPMLVEDSPEYAIARAAGWEVAYDGMEMTI